MLASGQADDSVFAACLRLFQGFPLAVRRHYAEFRYGSMVLRIPVAGTARFYVLIMEWEDLFVLRPWDRRDGTRVEIRPGDPVVDDVRWVIESGIPVPRDGALLGWLAGHQVQALIAARGRLAEPWDDPTSVPEVLTMPLVGSQPGEWPPLAASPLDDWRLWEYVELGRLADLTTLVSRQAGRTFLIPEAGIAEGLRAGSRIVVTERLVGNGIWLPAGVYADDWTLRDGSPPQSVTQLLALPGAIDLARGTRLAS